MFRLENKSGTTLLRLAPGDAVLIGRGSQCDLQLNDPAMSRVHCQLTSSCESVSLKDVGSRWGTLVNGQKTDECDLRPGDRIHIGETTLILEAEGKADRTALAISSDPEHSLDASATNNQFPDAEAVAAEAPVVHFSEFKKNENNSKDKSRSGKPDLQTQNSIQSDTFVGRTFHRYRVQQVLATTSSGVVFRAIEETTGQPIALKLFHPSFFSDDIATQRFERAARTMFGHSHTNIVELYNAGRSGGHVFTASQLIEGVSAVQLIRRFGVASMLDPSTVLQIAVDLCEALKFAESKEIVHRNIKPSNILIREADRAALLNDLILAKASTTSGGEQLTQAGHVLGDISYVSPEQLGSGRSIDCRSDIYQLGATLYALLTGRAAFSGSTFAATIQEILTVKPEPVQASHMATPKQFDAVVLKMLKKNPEDRFQTAAELAVALKKVAAETGQRNIKTRDADPKATGWSGALDGLV